MPAKLTNLVNQHPLGGGLRGLNLVSCEEAMLPWFMVSLALGKHGMNDEVLLYWLIRMLEHLMGMCDRSCLGSPTPWAPCIHLFQGRPLVKIIQKQEQLLPLWACWIVDIYVCVFVCIQGAMQFLENYEKEDITVAELEGNSNSLWTISPPSKQKMIQELTDPNSCFSVVFSWSIQR